LEQRQCEILVPELKLHAGESVAVVGPSGCGKTTLIELLALVRKPALNAGVFEYNVSSEAGTKNIRELWRSQPGLLRRIRACALSYSPQKGGYVPSLSVSENIQLRCALADQKPPDITELNGLLGTVGLNSGMLSRKIDSLSAGEKQRVVVLQSLAIQSELFIADEPTSALHPNQSRSLLALLKEQAEIDGIALLVATHDIKSVQDLGFRVIEGKSVNAIDRDKTIFEVREC
jgi:putative ABC transport system ATP-binding protein